YVHIIIIQFFASIFNKFGYSLDSPLHILHILIFVITLTIAKLIILIFKSFREPDIIKLDFLKTKLGCFLGYLQVVFPYFFLKWVDKRFTFIIRPDLSIFGKRQIRPLFSQY